MIRHPNERSRCCYISPSHTCFIPVHLPLQGEEGEWQQRSMFMGHSKGNFLWGARKKGIKSSCCEGGFLLQKGLHCYWWSLALKFMVLQRNATVVDVWIIVVGGLGTEASVLIVGLWSLVPAAGKMFFCDKIWEDVTSFKWQRKKVHFFTATVQPVWS